MKNIYDLVEESLDEKVKTENGALGYATTHNALLDMFYLTSSFRNNEKLMIDKFEKVLESKDPFAFKYLFFLRDIRGGMGERDEFRTLMYIFFVADNGVKNKGELFDYFLNAIEEYGRFDDIFHFLGTEYAPKVVEFVRKKLSEDFTNYRENKPISLLAKWMPSCNTSNDAIRRQAQALIKGLGTTAKEYRKTLSTLRKYLRVIEPLMCAKEWDKIDYNAVPSCANRIYGKAFLRNDEKRRLQYLNDLAAGKKGIKINSSVNFPHDVLHLYRMPTVDNYYVLGNPNGYSEYNTLVEELWKNLKELKLLSNTMVVRDDSLSMCDTIAGTRITAYEVATALAIYAAERLPAHYKNKIISFSENPKYLDFSDENKYYSLFSKYSFLSKNAEYGSTDIEKVFDLVLTTAIENNLKQNELPSSILILSDMEFNYSCVSLYNETLFTTIKNKYEAKGYMLPRLIFWNILSRTGAIPMIQNELGVYLISGFSVNVLRILESDEVNPVEAFLSLLSDERYENFPLVEYEEKLEVKETNEKMKTPDFLSEKK